MRKQEFRFQTHLPSPARRGSRSRPPLRRPRPLRFERLRVPVWNPYSRGRLSPAKSEDRKGGEGKTRSEEHTSELQSPCNLVCRLLLEKKKKKAQKRMCMAT